MGQQPGPASTSTLGETLTQTDPQPGWRQGRNVPPSRAGYSLTLSFKTAHCSILDFTGGVEGRQQHDDRTEHSKYLVSSYHC